MAKLTLVDIAAGYVQVATINANNALIEAALENTLSRDGTVPNTMSADLDMNSNRVTNHPAPINASDIANKEYVDDIAFAVTNASGSFSPALTYEWTNTQRFQVAITIEDATLADSLTLAHDGTDINATSVNTTNINWLGGPVHRIYDSVDTDSLELSHNGTSGVVESSNALLLFTMGGDILCSMLTDALRLDSSELVFTTFVGTPAQRGAQWQLWYNFSANELQFKDGVTDSVGKMATVTTGSFTGTLTGFGSPPSGTINWTRTGDIVTLYIDVLDGAIQAVSNSQFMTMTGLPSDLQPTVAHQVAGPGVVDNNLTLHYCSANIATDGVISFLPNSDAGVVFTASGQKGLPANWSLTYVAN